MIREENKERNTAADYISEHGGVIKTRVSPENAFNKVRLENPRAQVEDMADKLMSKLPDIMEDMRKLDNENMTAGTGETKKVIVNERNAAAVAEKTAQDNAEMLNFSL